ncbi:MAG: DNA-binding response regulator [Chloroflexi bacterium HGW-Chloroflexi-4]|jgi:NarL family two-component system response regulator LiaR|nr:MAG: DNA-binding response regulator [Chloroflexi bacterium HGW-Chloroflexi-4]
MEDKIRIMLVDDHSVVRSGLSAFLSVNPDFELVGEAENGEQAVSRATNLQPNVILMDLMMPIMDGVAATAAIKKQNPAIQIIALTSFQEDELVQNALKAGAVGYLMKNVSARELAAAIRAAKDGKMTLSPEAAQALVRASQQAQETETLTEREQEVLKLMVEGLNNAEIAERLVVSLSTVKYHISNILMKLGVDNRVAAVTMAIQKKLIK